MRYFFIFLICTACVTEVEKEQSIQAQVHDCFLDLHANLEQKTLHNLYLPVRARNLTVPKADTKNIVVVKKEASLVVVNNGQYCRRKPQACKFDRLIEVKELEDSDVAKAYVLEGSQKSLQNLSKTLLEAKSCLEKQGQNSLANSLIQQERKLFDKKS